MSGLIADVELHGRPVESLTAMGGTFGEGDGEGDGEGEGDGDGDGEGEGDGDGEGVAQAGILVVPVRYRERLPAGSKHVAVDIALLGPPAIVLFVKRPKASY